MIGERKELELNLIQPTLEIKRKRNTVNDIKQHLSDKYDILSGNVQSWINDPAKELPNLDVRLLCLFAEQIYQKTGIEDLNIENYFTEHEIKKARQYSGKLEIEDELEFPISFSPVIMIDRDKFSFVIDLKTLAKLSAAQKLHYNFDIQREAKRVKRGNQIFKEAKLAMENVMEIKENLHKNNQEVTSIVLNAAVRTADSGSELSYNDRTMTLTINKGTRLDIVDGYHRTKATELAINENPNLDGKFLITMLNYTDDNAAKYQSQLAKATPISKQRQQYLEGSRNSDLVAKELMKKSDLNDKVSDINQIHSINNELVTYNVLADSIDKYFKLERMADVYDTSDYLIKYFNILLGSFPEEFLDNPNEIRKVSLINENNMFVGYILLASRMMNDNIDASQVRKYIKEIDFSRNNPMWKEIGVLNSEGKMNTEKTRTAIEKFFSEIKL